MVLQIKRFKADKSSALEQKVNEWLREKNITRQDLNSTPIIFFVPARKTWYCMIQYFTKEER